MTTAILLAISLTVGAAVFAAVRYVALRLVRGWEQLQ